MAMYDNENTVLKSFNVDYISEYLIQAQWAEFVELKKVITEISDKKNGPVTILDIGVGNARIPRHLCSINEIWDRVKYYDGTDNAQACIDISQKEIQRLNISDKVSAYFIEASHLDQWTKKYDLVITTWFTAGNFYPDGFPFDTYKISGKKLDLTSNSKFTCIFQNAYGLLNPHGEVVIGACYNDNEATRIKQEESYDKMGMTVITDKNDSFTATREGFWSQRFTRGKLFHYLSFAEPSKIHFTPLDTYDYAMQVRIKK
jgi:SAM-dependent methyltransferase